VGICSEERGREEKWAGTNLESEIDEVAWFEFNSGNKTHPVERKNRMAWDCMT